MAQKKITDLTLRSSFDATCNLPADDGSQTWRVTGAQLADFINSQLPLTPLVPYAMVITGTTTNPTKGAASIDAALWRRVGDCMELRYDLIQTGAGSAGSGIYLFSIPTGKAMDTTKITPNNVAQGAFVGHCAVQNPGNSGSYYGGVFAYDATHLALFLSSSDSKSYAEAGPANFLSLSNIGAAISFTATIPIDGWG